MKRPGVAAAVLGVLLAPAALQAAVSQRVPVVTQVQGVVFYRTFLMIGIASGSPAVSPTLTLTYRSPVDGSIQKPALTVTPPIAGGTSRTYEDVIQSFKNAGVIRSQDQSVGLFGTLQVSASALTSPSQLSVVARTYSPATGGGTNGIAYVGRDTAAAGSASKLVAFVRNGEFGTDGTTRANIGFVNEGTGIVDVRVTYIDAATGTKIKDFNLSSVRQSHVQPGRGRPAEQHLRQLRSAAVDSADQRRGGADHGRKDLRLCRAARFRDQRRLVLPDDRGGGAVGP